MLSPSSERDTIAAIATPPGKGGIAVVKVSGPEAVPLATGIVSSTTDPTAHERRMVYGRVLDKDSVIDEALVCVMYGPHSYTGEDVVEIQVHGGFAAAETILALLTSRGVRQALPGEFTRRAFLNGRIDLAQAEGVLEIVASDNREHLRQAQQLLAGAFSGDIQGIIDTLSEVLMLLEASIDFSDETADTGDRARILPLLGETAGRLDAMIDSRRSVQRIKHGVTAVLAGPVNVGKSCLFNTLLGNRRAIVNETPGTTRDWIESLVELDGIPINLIDTAGIREAQNDIERAGIGETTRLIDQADIVLFLHDDPETLPSEMLLRREEQVIQHIVSKSDLLDSRIIPEGVLAVSSVQGTGIAELRDTIAGFARDLIRSGASPPPILVDRHRHELALARENIRNAVASAGSCSEEIIAYEVRSTLGHLEAILGRNIDIDVLDEIFSRFCIGK
ncbi:tRNA uridine-5-carboxymethylaminomethyl(34) synthesis GTPase MnmE [Candidatus Latescibacterota bacterium]